MAMAMVSAQAGCQLLSTSFRKELTSGFGDALECSSQSFLGSPRSRTLLCGEGGVEQTSQRSVPATSASLISMAPSNFVAKMISSSFMGRGDVRKDLEEEDGNENVVESSSEFLETVNDVLADVIDGQRFLKETGRRKPRPMKRRSLVVCLAMGAIQPYLSEAEERVVNLRRTASSSFARTICLASQLSVGASKAIESIAEEYRKGQQQGTAEVETAIGNLRRTTSSSLARAKSLVSQLSIGASRAVNYITEELRNSDGDQLASAAA